MSCQLRVPLLVGFRTLFSNLLFSLAVIALLSGVQTSNTLGQTKLGVEDLIKQLKSDELDERRDASFALARLGQAAEAAVPELAEAISDRDTQVWNEATQALAHLGPKALPALNALLERADSRDEQRRYRTAYAIGRIGTASLSAVREQLSNDSSDMREVAVRAIGWMGSEAADAIPGLIARLDDDNQIVRECAIDSLGKIGAASTDQLIHALRDETSDQVKIGATKALTLIGPEANSATSTLVKLSATDDQDVRAAALSCLGPVAGQSPTILNPLTKAIQSESEAVHQAALESLVHVAPTLQKDAAAELQALLNTDDAAIARRVALVLGSYGENAAAVVPQLLEATNKHPKLASISSAVGRIGTSALEPTFAALRDGRIDVAQVNRIVESMPAQVKAKLAGQTGDANASVREIATLTVSKQVPLPKDAVSSLTKMLTDSEPNVRAAAAKSLQRIGGKAKSALPSIVSACSDETDSSARVSMLKTISVLQEDEPELIEFLASLLKEAKEDALVVGILEELSETEKLPSSLHARTSQLIQSEAPIIRSLATKTIVRIKGKTEETAGLVVAALNDPEIVVREQALIAVAELGDAASSAVDVIADQLSDDSAKVRIAAIESLGRIGSVAKPSFQAIVDLAEDSDTKVRVAVAKNIRKIDDEAERVLPILIKAVGDEKKDVRQMAAHELGEMEEAAASAVPALLEMLRKDDDSDAARQALREINTAGDDAVPLLLEIAQDDSSGRRSRYYALYLLRKMGSRAKSALPTLRKLAEKADGRYREYYERAIREITEDE